MSPRIYRVEAIILKRKNVGEADRILTVFSKQYGKLRLIAKGIRKITSHRAPHLEIFSRVEMMIHRGKTLDIVTEAQTLDGFYQLRNNLALVNGCYYHCELVDVLLPEKQEHRDVYELYARSLAAFNTQEGMDITGSCEQFALALLRMLGFLPQTRELSSVQIQPFIESISERHMRTYHFLKQD
ncbi:DNA repair protein RecO [Candidatus Gottesmanbacteria bacterium RIFCSPHIGHO2_01_FULL_46_14]|uniref:DNA repair protein RecO n=2 Tax=Candidatus Gottesmaniibacteriota TaxID=1752720 RepID=A0A1F5ZQ72_9BACT|nr:MAG: DNA repair protein RecO [Candidatus Gottesmanbacteria bacterium RIFCSPHIGHO2_01_FULL_46_14]OGG28825.1 MAG: DNA repair protein RecO [Candidatus Gottesmanbacteria bacterium RIFCSPLOWO2_01_FULL_46_21]